ncbi:hypothetical protein L596_026767 [Steinernema carpocapsae]|uniref:Uncharacterized protein n=1 Tax=Steinernema carpocapsae TaxID=34508 RepID=A0A4U5M2D9_STECR|nr:hypothetical protein L596_026767 [Steinernema carpocapsae]
MVSLFPFYFISNTVPVSPVEKPRKEAHKQVNQPAIEVPSLLGSNVLSPWIFVPVILNPRVLDSLNLSPFVFCPVILTQ